MTPHRLAELRKEAENQKEHGAVLLRPATVIELLDALERCRRVLRDVEWSRMAAYGLDCPSCFEQQDVGHRSDCALAAALRG